MDSTHTAKGPGDGCNKSQERSFRKFIGPIANLIGLLACLTNAVFDHLVGLRPLTKEKKTSPVNSKSLCWLMYKVHLVYSADASLKVIVFRKQTPTCLRLSYTLGPKTHTWKEKKKAILLA